MLIKKRKFLFVSLFASSLLFANETILDEIKVTDESEGNFTGYIKGTSNNQLSRTLF